MLELRDALFVVQLDRNQSEVDVRHLVICGGRAGHYLLKALRRGFDADARKALAQAPRPVAAKHLTSHL